MNHVPLPIQTEQTDTHRWQRGLLAFLLGLMSLVLCLELLNRPGTAGAQSVTVKPEDVVDNKGLMAEPAILPILALLPSATGLVRDWQSFSGGDNVPLSPIAAWAPLNNDVTYSEAWGDMDGDGDLDLATGNFSSTKKIYINEEGVLLPTEVWASDDFDTTRSVAWGDMDGDGDLDLAAGSSGNFNKVYLNEEGMLQTMPIWTSEESDDTLSVAWGDMNGDGYLDLATGDIGRNKIYINEGGVLQTTATWFSDDSEATSSIAWGDMDGDGDLDLAAGNRQDTSRVYLNEGGVLQTTAIWFSDNDVTTSVAWGDMDGDGDLDLAVGNEATSNKVYLNEGGTLQTLAVWTSDDFDYAQSVAWGDVDSDGDLDLAIGSLEYPIKVYLNQDGMLQTGADNPWTSADSLFIFSVIWGDMDGDGDLDLAAGGTDSSKVYLNELGGLQTVADNPWASGDSNDTRSVAWGDVDGDGDLDLAAGNGNGLSGQPNKVYLNEGGVIQTANPWLSGDSNDTQSVAWGDVDGDGDLDLAAGNSPIWDSVCFCDVGGENKVYLNDGGMLQTTVAWTSEDNDQTASVAWGDIDGDGDLDLAAGNNFEDPNKVYFNEGGVLQTIAGWVSADSDFTHGVAWGDMDGDGDLDLAAGNGSHNKVYLNERGMLQTEANWASGDGGGVSVAWGDIDGDGDLDLASGSQGEPNKVYLNEGGMLHIEAAWVSSDSDFTRSIAWGDVDGDGDLDLIAGNASTSKVYLNGGAMLHTEATWISGDGDNTHSVAWGDVDGDGDPDLATGNWSNPNKVHLNTLQPRQEPLGSPPLITATPLLISARANFYFSPAIIQDQIISITHTLFDTSNSATGLIKAFYSLDGSDHWQPSSGIAIANSVVTNALLFDGINDWVQAPSFDINDDFTLSLWVNPRTNADQQLFIGKHDALGENLLLLGYYGNGYHLRIRDQVYEAGTKTTGWQHLAVVGESSGISTIVTFYKNGRVLWQQPFNALLGDVSGLGWVLGQDWDGTIRTDFFGGQMAEVRIWNVAQTQAQIQAGMYQQIAGNETNLVAYWPLDDGEGNNVVMDKGPNGYNATLGAGVANNMPAWQPGGLFTSRVFEWDTFASGFFGQSDNVVLRFVANAQTVGTGITGTYHYPNQVPEPFMWPYTSATTFPFRVRGTQVQVYTDTIAANNEFPGALIYRLPAGQETGATFMSNSLTGTPWRTDQNGYLQGRGELGLGDRLVALYPITGTQNYTIYHTSAAVLPSGPNMHEVITPGVQQLVVSPDNTLILFNLVVSLEWDARQDTTFLAQLQNDLRRASENLYDLTNGQAALGNIHIYHDKGYWGHANIVIRASNRQRPSAVLGGITLAPKSDIAYDLTTNEPYILEGAYIPGQVAMPPEWNRFGNPGGTLGEDWPHTLAHELGHYLFFVSDNYLGLNANDHLTIVDCHGSAMTDPYLDDYSEFLTRDEWTGDCLNTLAERYLHRADWETIETFWPMLDDSGGNDGPNRLPLATTQIKVFEHTTATMPIPAPFFSLVGNNGQTIAVPSGRGEAYLIKTEGNSDPTNDSITSLGTPVGNLVQARGTEPGDRLCVYDYSHDPFRFGCLEEVGTVATSVVLQEMPADWLPQVQVTPINSATLAVTVTNVSASQLNIQLLPAIGAATDITSMTAENGDFHQIVTALGGAYYGHLRIWIPGSAPLQEMIVEFVGIEDWGGQAYAWGGQAYAWGGQAYAWGGQAYAWGGQAYAWGGQAYAWGAPVMSSDGQVSVFPLENLFGSNRNFTLQKLPLAPSLPDYLTPVGQAYRFGVEGTVPSSDILFRYLGADVPAGHEGELRIYYSRDEGLTWERLTTILDTPRNQASAQVQGEGIYLLVATIATPELEPGWNLWSYPQTDKRPVVQALESIQNDYTSIYHYDSSRTPRWLLHDQTVLPAFTALVNDLEELESQQTYFIYALKRTTAYIAPPRVSAPYMNGLELPPATFYGWITPTANFAPQVGDPVRAYINGRLCGESAVTNMVGINQLAYKLQVRAENGNGCGVIGREITFVVAGQIMPNNHTWHNNQACYHPLGVPSPAKSDCFFLYQTYFPIIWNNYTPAPDLVITQLTATQNNVQLVIRNQGQTTVNNDFWVDAYINPAQPPTKVNDIWQNLSPEGLVWGVVAPGSHLAPGETLMLTIGDAYYTATYSLFSGTIAPNIPIFAQVDSTNAQTNYGNVLENHEHYGQTYNNISGPVFPGPGTLSAGSQQQGSSHQPQPHLPPR